MKPARRRFLHLAASAAALPALGSAARTEPMRPLAERLADYADRLRFEDIDQETVERVKAHVIDTIGCGIAAFNEGPVRICRDIALAPADGKATVIGTTRRSTPELASFANGVAFRYYDLNDAYVGGLSGHPSDNIAPCLAVAEAEGASATDLITAIVLVYEITCRLIDACDVMSRGWDAPVFSLPAVALAAGKLMKLPPAKLAEAVNLALNDHISMGQTRVQGLSDWKGLADAEAGRNAIFATVLARAGITGPTPVFEGRRGFFQLVSGPAEVDVTNFGGRGSRFRIHRCGLKSIRPSSIHKPLSWRASNSPKRLAISIASPRSKSRPPAAASSRPGPTARNGRRKTAPRPTTACPISPRARCSTVTSPTTVMPTRSCAIRASSRS